MWVAQGNVDMGAWQRAQDVLFASAYLNRMGLTFATLPAPIVFNTEVSDTFGLYNAATGVFTAPVAGLYHFDAQVVGDITGTNYMLRTEVDVSDTTRVGFSGATGGAISFTADPMSRTVALNAARHGSGHGRLEQHRVTISSGQGVTYLDVQYVAPVNARQGGLLDRYELRQSSGPLARKTATLRQHPGGRSWGQVRGDSGLLGDAQAPGRKRLPRRIDSRKTKGKRPASDPPADASTSMVRRGSTVRVRQIDLQKYLQIWSICVAYNMARVWSLAGARQVRFGVSGHGRPRATSRGMV